MVLGAGAPRTVGQLCFDGNKHLAGTDARNKMAAEMVDLISAAEYRSTATSLSQCSQHIPEKEATIPNVQSTSPACRDRNGETGCGPAS
jgi:hypothetical protein